MATTYTLISSNVLSGSAASVTFSSIPSTYTDLVVKCSSRMDTTGPDNLRLQFNGASSSYSRIYLVGTGSVASSGSGSSQSYIFGENLVEGTNYTSSTFGSTDIYIPSYTASQNKPLSIDGTLENNATASYRVAQASLWSNTAAITSIVISPGSGNFVSGSSFYLYGIKNS